MLRGPPAAELIEHTVPTFVGQRLFGIALGYADLDRPDELRHDPVMAALVGKLVARRRDRAPVAGQSTLNRLELSRPEPSRYHKLSHDRAAIEGLLFEVFLDAQVAPTEQTTSSSTPPTIAARAVAERFFHGYYEN